MSDADRILAHYIEKAQNNLVGGIKAAADSAGVSLEVAHASFAAALRPWLRTQGAVTDGREAKWHVRVRLYAADRPNDVEADTDPDLPPTAPGAEIVSGLPSVAAWVANCAQHYHGMPCVGLDGPTMRHKLKGLRPTLSRRGGNATWRLHYKTAEREWLARVDIVRVESTEET